MIVCELAQKNHSFTLPQCTTSIHIRATHYGTNTTKTAPFKLIHMKEDSFEKGCDKLRYNVYMSQQHSSTHFRNDFAKMFFFLLYGGVHFIYAKLCGVISFIISVFISSSSTRPQGNFECRSYYTHKNQDLKQRKFSNGMNIS